MSKKDEVVEEAVQEELPEVKGPTMRKKVTGITNDAALTVKVTANPKREGSNAYKTFAIYLEQSPETVQAALDLGIGKDHIQYDHLHGFIEVAGAVIEEYEVTPRGPRTDAAAEETAEPEVEGEDGF